VTSLDLVNIALELAGLERVGKLEEPSANAKLAQTILRADLWPCAYRYVTLVEDTTTVNASPYAKLFTLPENLLRVISVNGRMSAYIILGGIIACDDDAVVLAYLKDVSSDNPLPFPGDLAQAIACELATIIAEAKEPKKAALLRAEASRALLVARIAAGFDRAEIDETPTAWVDA
jgi:hypothetical protein